MGASDEVTRICVQAAGTEKSYFLELEPPCFYAVTSFLYLNELPTLMAVCRRFRDLIDTDECLVRCEGLFVDGALWFDRVEDPPGWALLRLGLRLEKQAPHLYTIAVSSNRDRTPPLQLQQFLTLNAGICRSLWVYNSPGGFGMYLEDLVSQMHELREVGVVGEDMDSLFVRRFLKQLFSNAQAHVKTIWLGVGDHTIECLRAAVLKTASMSINTQSVFGTLETLHVNLGGYSCGLLALTGFLELLQKQLRDTCIIHLEGTLNISSFPSLSATSDGRETGMLGSIEEAYDRVFRYNSAGPAVDGGTDFCSRMDQDVLLNSLRTSKQQRSVSLGGGAELRPQQQHRPLSPLSRFRHHSFSIEGLTLRKSTGGTGGSISAMSHGLSALRLSRLIEFRCSLRRCEGEYEAAGERRLHRLLAATFSSLPKDAVEAYNAVFFTSHVSLPSLVVELPRHSRFPVPLHLLSRFKAMLSAFLSEFSVLLLQLPTGPPFEIKPGGGSSSDAGVKEVVDFLGETNCEKIAGIQLDLQHLPGYITEAPAAVDSALEAATTALAADANAFAGAGGGRPAAVEAGAVSGGAEAGEAAMGEAGEALKTASKAKALAQLGDALSEGLEILRLQAGCWWVLRLKATRQLALSPEIVRFLEALLKRQGEPGVIEWHLQRDGNKGQQHIVTSSGALALGKVDVLLRERQYKRKERFCEWFDTVTYVKEKSR